MRCPECGKSEVVKTGGTLLGINHFLQYTAKDPNHYDWKCYACGNTFSTHRGKLEQFDATD